MRGLLRVWFLQSLFESAREPRNDGGFFLLALRRMAIQSRLLSLGDGDLLQLDAPAVGGADLHRLSGIELAISFARNHKIAIALDLEPGEVVLGIARRVMFLMLPTCPD